MYISLSFQSVQGKTEISDFAKRCDRERREILLLQSEITVNIPYGLTTSELWQFNFLHYWNKANYWLSHRLPMQIEASAFHGFGNAADSDDKIMCWMLLLQLRARKSDLFRSLHSYLICHACAFYFKCITVQKERIVERYCDMDIV